MKKTLFVVAVAAIAMTACTNEKNEYVGDNSPKEIAFKAISTPPTRAALESTTFPDNQSMQVSAYSTTGTVDYFADVQFNGTNASKWSGTTAQYWPYTLTTLNFLAYTGLTAGSATWDATHPASAVTLVMGDNKTAQNDLMYACGTGSVTAGTTSAFTFPTDVPMEFKHAQSLVKFTVKAHDATAASSITVTGITLNTVSCQGTFTVTHTNWDKTKAERDADNSKDGSVDGVWSSYDAYAGNVAAIKPYSYTTLSASQQDYACLMIVPNQGMASFTVNFKLGTTDYSYTYNTSGTTFNKATKYTYNIEFTLHEILITPSVADWGTGSGADITI